MLGHQLVGGGRIEDQLRAAHAQCGGRRRGYPQILADFNAEPAPAYVKEQICSEGNGALRQRDFAALDACAGFKPAPGKSIDIENDKILSFLANRSLIKISVNFECKTIRGDYIFVSNPKRYEALEFGQDSNLIATSNIRSSENAIIVDYFNLLSEENYVRDNSTMMLIKLLIDSGASKIYLAGVDGYDNESKDNYTIFSSALVTSHEYMTQMNKAMNNILHKYMQEIDIQFVTSEKMIRRV